MELFDWCCVPLDTGHLSVIWWLLFWTRYVPLPACCCSSSSSLSYSPCWACRCLEGNSTSQINPNPAAPLTAFLRPSSLCFKYNQNTTPQMILKLKMIWNICNTLVLKCMRFRFWLVRTGTPWCMTASWLMKDPACLVSWSASTSSSFLSVEIVSFPVFVSQAKTQLQPWKQQFLIKWQ